jgi:hypothetical protein
MHCFWGVDLHYYWEMAPISNWEHDPITCNPFLIFPGAETTPGKFFSFLFEQAEDYM